MELSSEADTAAEGISTLHMSVHSPLIADALATLVLLAAVVTVRVLAGRIIRRKAGLTTGARRRWLVSLRNAMWIILFAGLAFIWAHQLRTFALSIVAVAVAIVLATKELILCLSGSVMRTLTNAFEVGDRIELDETRGDVVDTDWMATKVLETGPGQGPHQYTGRQVVIPNSLLLSHRVINESFLGRYVVNVLEVPISIRDDWRKAESILLAAAREQCEPVIEEARLHMSRLKSRFGVDPPSVDPRVVVEVQGPESLVLHLRFPARPPDVGRMEQAILRRFLGETRPPAQTDP